jgi:hypothetical protein
LNPHISVITPTLEHYGDLDGYEFEKWLVKLFNRLGYQSINTQKSRDQGADLILSKDGLTYVVQAKKTKQAIANSAIQQVVAAKSYYHADKTMVVATSRFTDSAMKLAAANQVELWDGEKLENKFEESKGKSQIRLVEVDWNTGNGSLDWSCNFCGERHTLAIVLEKILYNNDVSCQCCGTIANIKCDMRGSFVCSYCGYDADTRQDMVNHVKTCSNAKL